MYLVAGVVGLSTAVYISSLFLKRTFGQAPKSPDEAALELPPLPDPEAPAADAPPPKPVQTPTSNAPPLPSAPPSNAPPLPPTKEAQAPPALPSSDTPQATPPAGQGDGNLRSLLEGIIEDFNYEVSGRRDPFLPYTSPKAISVEEEEEIVSPLQRFELDQLKLIGIIWDTRKPKAMFLDPSGKGYIVGKLDKVGRNRGYIAEIREGEVIILERYVGEGRSTFQTRSIRLERE